LEFTENRKFWKNTEKFSVFFCWYVGLSPGHILNYTSMSSSSVSLGCLCKSSNKCFSPNWLILQLLVLRVIDARQSKQAQAARKPQPKADTHVIDSVWSRLKVLKISFANSSIKSSLLVRFSVVNLKRYLPKLIIFRELK
jgi:hypothetical protein